MTKRAITRLKKYATTAGNAAKWLWLLPPVRSVLLTNLARIGIGSTAVAVVSAIADGLVR